MIEFAGVVCNYICIHTCMYMYILYEYQNIHDKTYFCLSSFDNACK